MELGPGIHAYFASLAGERSARTPWGNFLLVQKVTKNTLRGFTPKDPKFLEQGRGVYCFTHCIESRQELPTLLVSFLRLPACKNWEAKTRERLLLFFSCCPWCGGESKPTPPSTALARSEAGSAERGGAATTRAKADENPVEWAGTFPVRQEKASFSFGPAAARFLFGKTKRKWGADSVSCPAQGREISTTRAPNPGVLRGGTPKCPFAYFSGMGKVGPRRVETLIYSPGLAAKAPCA